MTGHDDFLTATQARVEDLMHSRSVGFRALYFALVGDLVEVQRPHAAALARGYARVLSTPAAAHNKLLFMAAEEACGTAILRHFARWADQPLRDELGLHADDEERHTKMLARAAHAFAPHETRYRDVVVDPTSELAGAGGADLPQFLWSIHLSEIMSYSRYHLCRDIAASLDSVPTRRLVATMDSLMRDELRHIAYTAGHIDGWLCDGTLDADALRAAIGRYEATVDEELERLEEEAEAPGAYPFRAELDLVHS